MEVRVLPENQVIVTVDLETSHLNRLHMEVLQSCETFGLVSSEISKILNLSVRTIQRNLIVLLQLKVLERDSHKYYRTTNLGTRLIHTVDIFPVMPEDSGTIFCAYLE